jgi:hypothetical protein
MHTKYMDVLEYFRESRSPKPAADTLLEFQNFDGTYQEMSYLLHGLNLTCLDPDVLHELPS